MGLSDPAALFRSVYRQCGLTFRSFEYDNHEKIDLHIIDELEGQDIIL